MFRNQYDTDVTTFSPDGRLHQVEYAMEAIKLGGAVVGVKSKEFAVVAALKRSQHELGSFQKKVFEVDTYMGIGVSGLIADARQLAKYMRSECLEHYWAFESHMQVGRLVTMLSDKAQVYTQKSEKRPYGVGLMVIGYDKTGPHLFETQPTGNCYEYTAQAIGANCQSAKTYLEKHYTTFEDLDQASLIKHALTALKGTSTQPLSTKNATIAIVGKDTPLKIFEDDDIAPYLEGIVDEEAEEKENEED